MEERPVNQTYGDICPPGSFCELGSKAPNACREGYFARGEGNDNPSACQMCKYNTSINIVNFILYSGIVKLQNRVTFCDNTLTILTEIIIFELLTQKF